MRIKTIKEYIDTPALIIDLDGLEFNLKKMADYFEGIDCSLRPHIKTHKCPIMARKQIEAGAIGITCAKVGEAYIMAQAGIKDILIANQVVGAKKTTRLLDILNLSDVKVAVEGLDNIVELNEAAGSRDKAIKVLIEVDVGMHRCGVKSKDEALTLAKAIDKMKNISLSGIMGYEGHIIFTNDRSERERLGVECMEILVDVKEFLEREGFPIPIVSAGGTGTYDISSKVKGITEIQAGSYLTMDVTYGYLDMGFEKGLTLLTTVISVKDDYVILDCGMKSITGEFGMPLVKGIDGVNLSSLSEEHGHLDISGDIKLKVGDKIELVPTHGCTTINLHDKYYVVRGDVVEGVWGITARGRFE